MPPAPRQRAEEREYTHWDRARLSVVVPIGVIVAVAIVCIVVAVLSSAQRADDVAVVHERQLLTSALRNYGERVLHEVESVATSDAAVRNIRTSYKAEWAKQHVGDWLVTYFDHDYVFVFDSNDRSLYSINGRHATDAKWAELAKENLGPVIDYMRGRDPTLLDAIRLADSHTEEGGAHAQ
ncbi:MAG TPA: CHASE4 domain-containing protein, partial [Burkholderiales bacterium]|nr:CHASE4 domain-containing protein [Burkholderiales bacterium]